MVTPLQDKISKFISTRYLSDGGYSKVTKEDLELLYNIVELLIELKWEADPDGDYPVDFALIDKKNERMDYYEPYPPFSRENMDDPDIRRKIFRTLNMNLQIAAGQMDVFTRITTDIRNNDLTKSG